MAAKKTNSPSNKEKGRLPLASLGQKNNFMVMIYPFKEGLA